MEQSPRATFGALLRQARRSRGWTQAELADKAGVSERAVSDLERGVNRSPRADTRDLLVRALAPTPTERAALEAAARRLPRNGREPSLSLAVAVPNPPPFVAAGREAQLARLRHALTAAPAGPRVLLVTGDAGIGKSWLVREACRLAEDDDPSLLVARGECSAAGGLGDHYQPLKQVLGLLTGEVGGASAPRLVTAENGERLLRQFDFALGTLLALGPALVGSFVPGQDLIARAKAFGAKGSGRLGELRRLLGAPTPPAQRTPDQLFEQYARVLTRLAEAGPTAIVLDDLHWADAGTCALLFYLFRHLRERRDLPLTIVGTYRPADLSAPDGTRHPMAQVGAEVQRRWGDAVVDLTETVGNDNGRDFVRALLASEPNRFDSRFRRLLFDRTEGQPLFATELLRWLREQGVLTRDGSGCWVVSRDITFDELPPRVEAVIAERVARLEPEAWRVLAAASVQGPRLSAEVVGAALGLERATLAARLDDDLVRRHRLLLPAGVSGAGRRRLHHYRFAHALFQDYVYRHLLSLQRESLHAATAAAMEAVYGGDAAEAAPEIARQFEEAGDATKAVTYFRLAGDQSNGALETESAIRYFERAIELAHSVGDRRAVASSLVGIANARRLQDKSADATALLERALALSNRLGDLSTKAACLLMLGWLCYDKGQFAASLAHLDQAVALARQIDDKSTLGSIENLMSHDNYSLGRYDAGLQHALAALQIARDIGDTHQESESLLAAGNIRTEVGAYEEAIASYAQALVIQRRTRNRRGEAISLANTGLCEIERGGYGDALAPLAEALRIAERYGRQRTQATAQTYFGLACEGLGRWADARRAHEAGLALRRHLGLGAAAMDNIAGLVRVALAEGDAAAQRAGVEQMLAWLAAHGTTGIESPVRVSLACARALTALGEPARARTALDGGYGLLMERAAQIADPRFRRWFVERVPCNRELIALRRAYDDPGPAPDLAGSAEATMR